VGAFFQELLRVGVYKRTQGRIARQATFAALVVAVALGLWRLNTVLQAYDPSIVAKPAMVSCTSKSGDVGADAQLVITAPATGKNEVNAEKKDKGKKDTEAAAEEKVTIALHSGDEFIKVAEAINAQSAKTGVVASVSSEDQKDRSLTIATRANGESQFLKVEVSEPALQVAGLTDGVARGCDELNLGLQFVVPSLLFLLTLWVSFRVVNVPAFADFLVAVEAEMNKVSWPTWHELSRASMIVLILIFALAFVLLGFDTIWALIFHVLGIT
jgi:preprotein translocase SecE subunit